MLCRYSKKGSIDFLVKKVLKMPFGINGYVVIESSIHTWNNAVFKSSCDIGNCELYIALKNTDILILSCIDMVTHYDW